MRVNLAKYQKLLPVGLLVIFLLGSLFYVALIYRPTVDVSINDKAPIHAKSRSDAEIEVYRQLPFKATFNLSTGESFAMDMRFLGLSYFSEKELKRLDAISSESFWGKFTPFFDTSQNQLISIYPNRIHWLSPLEKTLASYPHLLRQEPATNHLVVDESGNMTISERENGYEIEPANFIKAANEITKTGKFEGVHLESTATEAADESWKLAEYPNLVKKAELPLPGDYVQEENIKNAYYKMQNIYIAAGETMSISDLLGKLDAKSGYLAEKDKDGKNVYGVGVEQLIDAIQQLAQSDMAIKSYRGKVFNIGNPAKGLTELTVQNNTASDMVFSLSIDGDKLSLVLASK